MELRKHIYMTIQRFPLRQIAQTTAAENMVPELSRNHARQTDVKHEPPCGDPGEMRLNPALASNRLRVEITGLPQRIRAEQLVHPTRTL